MTSCIPDAALANHIAVLAKTGAGKSFAMRGVVEGLLDDGGRVCIVDPTGVWFGLRSSASGKRGAYPVTIFGGEHGDLPLAGAHGEILAEVIGTSSTPAIIDTSALKIRERTRFFADFADALMRKNRGPLHLIIDEAHVFAPQGKVNDPASGEMLHAANSLVSGGRARGLRVILISQRPAKLHKDSLTQCETLIAMRLIAPQDRAAIREWIEDNADRAQGNEIISSLATLKTGHGWIWAPQLGMLQRVAFPAIKTYDSMRAPDGADGSAAVLAPIDRDAIAEKLKAIGADVEANDPRALRKRIADLEAQLRVAEADNSKSYAARNEGFQEGRLAGAQQERTIIVEALHRWQRSLKAQIHEAIDAGLQAVRLPDELGRDEPLVTVHATNPKPATVRALQEVASRKAEQISGLRLNGSASSIGSGGKQRIMVALAQQGRAIDQRRLGLLTGLSPRSGTWSTYLSKLRGAGYIEGRTDLAITDAGREALGEYERLPTGAELIAYWRNRLGDSGKRAIFDVVVSCWPHPVSQESVAEKTNLSTRSGTWSTYLSELRGLGLIEGRGELRAAEELFE